MSTRDPGETQPLLLGSTQEKPGQGSRKKMSSEKQGLGTSTSQLVSNGTFDEPYDYGANEYGDKKKGITKERIGVVISILMTELCERLTYYSVVANLVLFCTSKLNMTSDEASNVNWVFTGTVYIIPVIGGYIADSFAGKYNTILGAGLIYLLGLFLLPASAIDYEKWFGSTGDDLSIDARRTYFYLGLVFVAIGTGGIKANVGPFGAQQVDDLGADAVQSFFNWFYWFINAGAIVAYSAVAYVQQEKGFDYGFLIPLCSMIVALIVFVVAKRTYRNTPPGESILKKSILVCHQSCNGCKNPAWDNARERRGGSYDDTMVDGVRAVIRVLPIFILVIVYWAVYSQMSTSLFLQSERLNIKVNGATLPAAMLNIFNTLIILILIPIMDRGVYPLLARLGRRPSHLQRIGIGLILAALAMVYAAGIEIYRKDDIRKNGYITQELADDKFNASRMTMFIQVPEFAFIGSSEVFASISGLEFAYSQAPEFMQGLVMGLFLMTSGLGSYVSTLLVTIVKAASNDDWFPKEPNDGHMEYLLFLLAGLTMVNFIVFVFVARMYKYRKPVYEQDPDSIIVPEILSGGSEKDEKGYKPQDSTKL